MIYRLILLTTKNVLMAHRNINNAEGDQTRQRTLRENWEVMRPFVRFSIKAMSLIGGALIGIIKLLPILLENRKQEPKKDNKVIKI
jgi:hypothetical protein